MAVRALVFVVFLFMAFVLSASLLSDFGIRDFFYLTLTTGSFVFFMVLLLSMTWYRPFCRLVCPYGALLSLGAWKSLFRLQRTDACIECKKCEKACPTDEAKREDAKAECYLCGRCTMSVEGGGTCIFKEPANKNSSGKITGSDSMEFKPETIGLTEKPDKNARAQGKYTHLKDLVSYRTECGQPDDHQPESREYHALLVR